jgi:hypothetical protein
MAALASKVEDMMIKPDHLDLIDDKKDDADDKSIQENMNE